MNRRRGRGERERTPAGQPILRHEAVERPVQAPSHGEQTVRDAIDGHLVAHLGPCSLVWHEIVSDLVHIDVFMWTPTSERAMYTFVTAGMSDLPMSVPEDAIRAGVAPRAELMVCLPSTWPVPSGGASWQDDDAYFPIAALKQLARLPHEYDTWLGYGHTIPNGDPPERLATATELCGWLLLPPITVAASFHRLTVSGSGLVDFFGLVGLHRDEMEHKLTHGVDFLFDGFERDNVSELLDIARPSSLRA